MTDETETDPQHLDFAHNTHPAAVGRLLEMKEVDEAPEESAGEPTAKAPEKVWAPAPAQNRPGGGYVATRGR